MFINSQLFGLIWTSYSWYQSCSIHLVTSLKKSMKTKQNYWQFHYYLKFFVRELNKSFHLSHIDNFSSKTRGNSLYCTHYDLSYTTLKFIFVHSPAWICYLAHLYTACWLVFPCPFGLWFGHCDGIQMRKRPYLLTLPSTLSFPTSLCAGSGGLPFRVTEMLKVI